jgi:NIMA (never in mitosis gene a)-related kinase
MVIAAHRDVGALLKAHGYREVKQVGEGSFGKAILVEAADGAQLVCKLVDVSKASAKEAQDAAKEAKMLAQFKHPYIVKYKESFLEGGWLFIIMDYCEGGELKDHLDEAKAKNQSIPEVQVLRWLTQGLLALKHLHSRHILHRDLKPANFFVHKNGSLKLGDFGISKTLANTLACAKTQIGTPYYLSPEVCLEKPYAWASDIWAMGCILYEMCTFKVPFDSGNLHGLMQKILRGNVPPIPSGVYSNFTRQLCVEMLSKDPTARPSADEILHRPQIQKIVRGMLEQAQATAMPSPLPRHESEKESSTTLEPDAESCCKVAMPLPAVAIDRTLGPYAGDVGTYRQGSWVEYYSASHSGWLPATVVEVHSTQGIKIDIKSSAWISANEQATRVRPRKHYVPRTLLQQHHQLHAQPGPAAMQKCPSVGSIDKVSQQQLKAVAAEALRRSPSVGSIVRRQSPRSWQRNQAAAAHKARPPLMQRCPSAADGRMRPVSVSPPASKGGTPQGSRVPSPHSSGRGDSQSPVGSEELCSALRHISPPPNNCKAIAPRARLLELQIGFVSTLRFPS